MQGHLEGCGYFSIELSDPVCKGYSQGPERGESQGHWKMQQLECGPKQTSVR